MSHTGLASAAPLVGAADSGLPNLSFGGLRGPDLYLCTAAISGPSGSMGV